MAIDLHRVLSRKQERECAKLDEFAFRHRARAMALFGDWLRQQGHLSDSTDPRVLAAATVTESDGAILARLLDELRQQDRRREWRRAFRMMQAQASRELTAELGDPTPHRLA